MNNPCPNCGKPMERVLKGIEKAKPKEIEWFVDTITK